MAHDPITYDRSLGFVDNYKVIDLFPYKFKDESNFIFRDHVPYIEGDKESLEYARTVARRVTEGFWLWDGGTPIWMPPKLYFYLNLGTIEIDTGGKSKIEGYPDFRDNEWIIASYLLCCDGFSGFADDPDFTSNIWIRRIEDEIEIPSQVEKKLQKHCRRKNGTYKKYIDPWDYLTWFYNKENSRGVFLGMPLYENESSNACWMASRGVGKTFFLGGGDASHELWTGGAMYYHELRDKPKVNLFMGASDSKYITTFMEATRVSFTNIPGKQFVPHPYFTKSATDAWKKDRESVILEVRTEDGSKEGSRSQLGKAVIQAGNPEVVVSTRSKRIYVDEFGLVPNSQDVHDASEPVLRSVEGKFGVQIDSGTGGNVEKIVQTHYIYTHPKEYSIFPIKNYWENGEAMGLFTPASYIKRAFKHNGNTDLIAATKDALADRRQTSDGDATKETGTRMNYSLIPGEIFLSGKSNKFDKEVLLDRFDLLRPNQEEGLFWKEKAKLYDLQLGEPISEGVFDLYKVIATPIDIKKYPERRKNTVIDWREQAGKTGEVVIFEMPMLDGREFLDYGNLYKVFYDPNVVELGEDGGESFGCVKVWKGKPQRALAQGERFNTIVATAKVRRDDHRTFLLLCLLYKAKGQYERNVNGIPEYFSKHGLKWLLQPTPLRYIKDIVPGARQASETGIFMNESLKKEAMKVFVAFHKAIVDQDSFGRKFKQCELWDDVSLMSEMVNYNDKGNFDDISAMLILMLWLESEFMPEDSKYANEELTEEWDDLARVADRMLA